MENGSNVVREEAGSDSVVGRLIGVITAPGETFKRIVANPTWVFPLILIVAASMVIGYFLRDLVWQNTLETMQQNPNFDPAQAGTVEKITKISAWAAPVLTVPIIYLIVAGLLLFVGNVIQGRDARFKTLFSVTCWSGIVSLVGSIVNVPMMLSKGELGNVTSLTFLAGDAGKDSTLYFVLSQIDLVYIWWVLVLGIGFSAVYNYMQQKGILTVFSMWVIYLVIAVGLKAAF